MSNEIKSLTDKIKLPEGKPGDLLQGQKKVQEKIKQVTKRLESLEEGQKAPKTLGLNEQKTSIEGLITGHFNN